MTQCWGPFSLQYAPSPWLLWLLISLLHKTISSYSCHSHQKTPWSLKYEHISPVLASLHWLPVKSRIDFKVLLLTYKALNDLAPNYLKKLVVPYCPPRPLRSQSAGLLVIPRISKTTVGGRAF